MKKLQYHPPITPHLAETARDTAIPLPIIIFPRVVDLDEISPVRMRGRASAAKGFELGGRLVTRHVAFKVLFVGCAGRVHDGRGTLHAEQGVQ